MGCYGLLRDDFDLIMVPSRLPHAPEADPCAREAPAPEAGPCVTEGSTEAGPSAEPPTPLRPPLQALDAMPGDTNRCERISGAAKAPTHPARLRPARCPPELQGACGRATSRIRNAQRSSRVCSAQRSCRAPCCDAVVTDISTKDCPRPQAALSRGYIKRFGLPTPDVHPAPARLGPEAGPLLSETGRNGVKCLKYMVSEQVVRVDTKGKKKVKVAPARPLICSPEIPWWI